MNSNTLDDMYNRFKSLRRCQPAKEVWLIITRYLEIYTYFHNVFSHTVVWIPIWLVVSLYKSV